MLLLRDANKLPTLNNLAFFFACVEWGLNHVLNFATFHVDGNTSRITSVVYLRDFSFT